jgi:uncharacterized membrane protein YsdA (DUF1294 family)
MFIAVLFFALVLLGLIVLIVYLMAKSRARKVARRHAGEAKQATRW